jgi:hypothetical protein
MRTEPVLDYHPPAPPAHGGRTDRRALLAFAWSLAAPAAGLGLMVAVGDTVDDVFERPPHVGRARAAALAGLGDESGVHPRPVPSLRL